MLVLALDTTTRGGSVAVVRDDTVLAVIEGDGGRTHGERLPGEIEAALAGASIERGDIDLFAVASGPGAFTGLRIGLAAVQGLAMALRKPVVGVSALVALAEALGESSPVPETRVAAWMDAQRGEVFSACYQTPAPGKSHYEEAMPPIVGAPAAILKSLPFPRHERVTFVGDGALRYRSVILEARNGSHIVERVPLLAPTIARIGRRLADEGAAGPPHALQPLYVRRPDAELERERQTGL